MGAPLLVGPLVSVVRPAHAGLPFHHATRTGSGQSTRASPEGLDANQKRQRLAAAHVPGHEPFHDVAVCDHLNPERAQAFRDGRVRLVR